MIKRIILGVVLVLAGGAGLYAAVVVVRAQSGLRAGQRMLAHQLWPQARGQLSRYLWLHPNDARARVLMAEALVKDESLPAADAASYAMNYLSKIPDSSPLAAEARLQQGRLCFLILQKPGRAEQLLRRASELQADALPAYQLLWTLLNVTGRAELCEDVFWRVYELSPEQERPLRLREWYMNQFFPLTATEPLDRMMGILAPEESPTRTTESRRLLRFRENEPEAPVNHAALAQWCQQEGDPDFAIRLLDAAAAELDNASQDPFFLATYIATLIDLGQLERAESCFQRWPKTDQGHLYWRSRGLILDEAGEATRDACEAYRRALEIWPGPIDWRLRHRRAVCLARYGDAAGAAQERARAEAVQELMKVETHERLRNALGSIQELEKSEIVDFYRKLGRSREADCWMQQIQRLRTVPTPRSVPDKMRVP